MPGSRPNRPIFSGTFGTTYNSQVQADVFYARTRRYNTRVFVFPPWREIYETDAERKQDWAEAERTFDLVLWTLPQLGYEPLVVPKGSVAERADFLQARA